MRKSYVIPKSEATSSIKKMKQNNRHKNQKKSIKNK